MPGFSDKLNPDQRWDLIDTFCWHAPPVTIYYEQRERANQHGRRAAASGFRLRTKRRAERLESITQGRSSSTRIVRGARAARAIEQLARLEPLLAAADSHIRCYRARPIDGQGPVERRRFGRCSAALGLFQSRTDGGETQLMLDRGSNVRARWTASGAGGVADAATLLRDAIRIASIPVAAANHAGHAH